MSLTIRPAPRRSTTGLHYTLATVPRAYDVLRVYEGMEGRKNTNKEMKNKKM
jgi:hypothetical protein